MEMVKLKVKGMHCSACEMLIRDILEDEEIKVINVSFKDSVLVFESKNKFEDLKIIKKLLAENKYQVME